MATVKRPSCARPRRSRLPPPPCRPKISTLFRGIPWWNSPKPCSPQSKFNPCCLVASTPRKAILLAPPHRLPKELTPVPLKFDTSSDYLQIFHDLQLEEVQTELATSFETGKLPRIGFKLILKDSYTEGSTRVCRLRAELVLPDRQTKPAKDWKQAEREQMDRAGFLDKGCNPVGLSSVGRGNVLIITDKPMVIRDGGASYYTEATIVELAMVWKSARPVGGGKDSLGGMDIDLALATEVAEQVNGKV
ncbi:hypothetical protein BASA81_012650 [Batrachochytrium salamandrivorans]|nr:hypothetical protein BASA81_012650 [Batrachochytrium salamandrivorans]